MLFSSWGVVVMQALEVQCADGRGEDLLTVR
jgi:hypothetical protein